MAQQHEAASLTVHCMDTTRFWSEYSALTCWSRFHLACWSHVDLTGTTYVRMGFCSVVAFLFINSWRIPITRGLFSVHRWKITEKIRLPRSLMNLPYLNKRSTLWTGWPRDLSRETWRCWTSQGAESGKFTSQSSSSVQVSRSLQQK